MISKRNPYAQTNEEEFHIEPCTFCEFVRNNSAMEYPEPEDERVVLDHLKVSDGLVR